MKKALRVFSICVTLASIGTLFYGAEQLVRHLEGQRSPPAVELLVALAGAAGVLIGITCFRTMDRTLYLGPGVEDQAVQSAQRR
jgi:hypothetical protein